MSTVLAPSGQAALAELPVVPLDRFWSAAAEGPAAAELEPAASTPLHSYSRAALPLVQGKSRRRFLEPLAYQAEPVRLYALPEVAFFGTPGLFASGGRWIPESAAHWRQKPPAPPAQMIDELRSERGKTLLGPDAPVVRLEGPHLLAASLFARNYFHWSLDLLAGLGLIAGHRPLKGMKVLVGWKTPLVLDSLAALGVAAEDVVVLPRDRIAVVDQLVATSLFQSLGPHLHPAAVKQLAALKRGLAPDAPGRGGRKLFASRGSGGVRPLVNRSEVEAAFARRGFEVFDPGALSFSEQVRLFSEAAVVVGEHGAALTSLAYVPRGTQVLELMHPAVPGWIVFCFLAICEQVGARHHMLTGEQVDGDSWRLDVGAALQALDAL